jgi:hypothetical protein
VLVKAGFNGSRTTLGCSEVGIYEIDAQLIGSSNLPITYFQGGDCGPEHIKGVSGNSIKFNMHSVDLLAVLSTATYSPTPAMLTTVQTPTPEPTIKDGSMDCDVDMSAGGAVRSSNNCWAGMVDGYLVSVTTGLERDMPEKDAVCGRGIQGFYAIDAWFPNADPYAEYGTFGHLGDREYAGCDFPLHIKSVADDVVTIDGSANFSVDLRSYIEGPLQNDHWTKGVIGCPPDSDPGNASRTSTGCWQGVTDGYDVFLRVGKEEGRPPGTGDQACSTQGFYYLEAWAPDSSSSRLASVPPIGWHLVYSKWVYTRCSALRIIENPYNPITLGDESNESVPFDMGALLSPTTPTP